MSDDRKRLNETLREMGYDMRGDLVIVHPAQSETREVRSSERAVVAEMTTEVGEAFSAGGIRLERFRKNPVVLWAHDYEGLPVARSLWERVRGGEDAADMFIVKLQFHLDTELSREVWALLSNDVEVEWEFGVVPEEWEFGTAGLLVTKWDLAEVSAASGGACTAEIRRRIKDHRISSPAMLRSVEGAEPEPDPEPEKTSADEAEGPYSWRWRSISGRRQSVVVGPELETRTLDPGDAAILAYQLNDAFRRGRESAAELQEPAINMSGKSVERRLDELEDWRAELDEKFARTLEQFERGVDTFRRWGDGPEEDV